MLWIVAADEKGFIKGPATDRISLPTYLKSACHLTDEPDLQLLSDLGFIEFGSHVDGPLASTRRQGDAKVTPARRPQTQKKTQTQKKIIRIPSSLNGADVDDETLAAQRTLELKREQLGVGKSDFVRISEAAERALTTRRTIEEQES